MSVYLILETLPYRSYSYWCSNNHNDHNAHNDWKWRKIIILIQVIFLIVYIKCLALIIIIYFLRLFDFCSLSSSNSWYLFLQLQTRISRIFIIIITRFTHRFQVHLKRRSNAEKDKLYHPITMVAKFSKKLVIMGSTVGQPIPLIHPSPKKY